MVNRKLEKNILPKKSFLSRGIICFLLFTALILFFPSYTHAACPYFSNPVNPLFNSCDTCFDTSVTPYGSNQGDIGSCLVFDHFSGGNYYYIRHSCQVRWKYYWEGDVRTQRCGVPEYGTTATVLSGEPLDTNVKGCWLTQYCG